MINSNLETFQMNLTFERSFLPARSSNIKIVAAVKGQITPEAFHNAVTKLALKHPLLRSRVIVRSDGSAYLTTEGGCCPKVIIKEERTTEDIFEAIYQEDLQPANWENDPTSRFFLFGKTGNQHIIVAYIHHTVADGRSVAFVMQHLLSLIANPSQEVKILPPISMLDAVPSDIKISKMLTKLLGMINKKWGKEKITFTMKDFLQVAQEKYTQGPEIYVDKSLTREETNQLRQKARNHGVSVNAMILAASILAKEIEEKASSPNKVGFAVDVRKKLTKNTGEACNLLASGLMVNPKYKRGMTFWELARNIHIKTLKNIKSNKKLFMKRVMAPLMDPTFNDAMYMMQQSSWEGTPMLKKMGNKKSPVGAVLTNLGGLSLPLDYLGQTPIKLQDAIFFPPIGVDSVIEIGASSLAGKLHLVTQSKQDAQNQLVKEKILVKIIEILQKNTQQ
ncbi:hypothetical protein NEF87_001760 [Candidatus Lokiarchaeum ossiferum]|uniref:Condensation domain-containing protein n=1 Tax=Candidatus Lokiarchaeum ossiferum TaxID=2951803 RepID=A0ABY6HPN3_9ARCH|nr:hypothetical protein NEF87_001760 [Candidatus Lokiarchaeum sp. B-35]